MDAECKSGRGSGRNRWHFTATMTQRASVRRRGRRRRAALAARLLRGSTELNQPGPDVRRWTHRGLTCMIRAGPKELGFFNGYVAVGPEHPWYRKYRDDAAVEIHGGLTYAALEPDGWVFGFDTGHAFDVWPGVEQKWKVRNPVDWDVEWTLEKLELEVQRLAGQLAEAQD